MTSGGSPRRKHIGSSPLSVKAPSIDLLKDRLDYTQLLPDLALLVLVFGSQGSIVHLHKLSERNIQNIIQAAVDISNIL